MLTYYLAKNICSNYCSSLFISDILFLGSMTCVSIWEWVDLERDESSDSDSLFKKGSDS